MRYLLFMTVCLFLFSACGSTGEIASMNCQRMTPRHEVHSGDTPAYRYICHITVERKFGTFPSTAFFISRDVLLTAGHSAGEWSHWKVSKNPVRSVTITLFEHYDDDHNYAPIATKTYTRSQLKKFGAHPNYKGKKGDRIYDYGYFKLPDDSLYSLIKGSFILPDTLILGDTTVRSKMANEKIYMAGYPASKQDTTEGSLWAKTDALKNISASATYLSCCLRTEEGDSGAPIWYKDTDGHYILIGIHNTGYDDFNGGVRVFNKETLETIKGWVK